MSRTYTGAIRDGVVVFEGTPPPLPTGTRVRIEPIVAEEPATLEGEAIIAGTRRLLLKWASQAEAIAPPMPADLAAEHDYYAHGKPRDH